MKLTKVAHKAAAEASQALGAKFTEEELEMVTSIIAKAMEKAVDEVSKQHAEACGDFLNHEVDLAHKMQEEIERKRIALLANLSSLR